MATTKNEKKEKKFNGERVARKAEKSLKAVFPNEAMHVSYFENRVEVLYPATSKITAVEINTFKAVFCELGKIKKEELAFSLYEKKAA
ncbi:MAG: hypothetical protein LBH43_21190 [Treponema sp.]|jgi:capsule polysaccharide export protein KpsE/RkpR|nr:hypothetical protein [Treponema sp.]